MHSEPCTGPAPDTNPGDSTGTVAGAAELQHRIRELELRLEESEETLDAIRRGDIDALVVSVASAEQRVYTLENADRPYRVLIEQIQEGAVTLGLDGTMFYCNRRLAEMLAMPQERVIGRYLQDFILVDEHGPLAGLIERATIGGGREEFTLRRQDGAEIPVTVSLSLLQRDQEQPLLCGVLADRTQQKQHLQELSEANARLLAESAQREMVEEALRQSQKMEAVGQLTGGLAHDFNNLLTGIVGTLQLIRSRTSQGRYGEIERYVVAALASTDRAAALTHRLLAFSRRQALDPKPVDPNRLIEGMLELLVRTVGPTIRIETRPDPVAGVILCDANQLENALLNLAINARDAMPDGGTVTIQTDNVQVEPRLAAARDMAAGSYVTIAVSDIGTGMTPEVAARAFDPFFTTKPIGMGTGLGLSMIYGFAKQSGGQARIHSRPGLGTTVRLYLPRVDAPAEAVPAAIEAAAAPRALEGQTVLVVDDEPVVRMLVVEVLEDLGYTALEAGDGEAALRCLEDAPRVDLLVTDVGLPGGMSGRQLSDLARLRQPALKVLFITGFAEGVAVGSGELDASMDVVAKPFGIDVLSARIQAVLGAGPG